MFSIVYLSKFIPVTWKIKVILILILIEGNNLLERNHRQINQEIKVMYIYIHRNNFSIEHWSRKNLITITYSSYNIIYIYNLKRK